MMSGVFRFFKYHYSLVSFDLGDFGTQHCHYLTYMLLILPGEPHFLRYFIIYRFIELSEIFSYLNDLNSFGVVTLREFNLFL